MAQYIDKDAVLTIIEKELSYYKDLEDRGIISEAGIAAYRVIRILKSDIDSLEVKEVDSDIMQRMEECPYRQVGCTMYEGHILECKGACSWVIDYPRLKELKAQKGE